MRLLSPTYWPWLLLLAAPIVLYLFRRRPRTVRVSTLAFFRMLAKAHQESPWLRRLKFLLSLLLSLLLIGLPAAGLLRPVVDTSQRQLKTLVILLDRSASMGATDPKGRSRMDEAIERIDRRLGSIGESTAVCLIAYDRRPEVLLPASHDRRQLERALRAVRVRPIEAGPVETEAAVQLADRLAGLAPPAAIWHVTDQPGVGGQGSGVGAAPGTGPEAAVAMADGPGATQPESGGGGEAQPATPVELIRVALPGGGGAALPINVGITAFHIRRVPMQPNGLEAFVQLQTSSPQPVEVVLDVVLDGRPIAVRKLSVGVGAPESLLVPLLAPKSDRAALLWLKLKTDRDCLAADNVAFAAVPPARPIRLMWITPQDGAADPFTQIAISSLLAGSDEGSLTVLAGKPSDWAAATGSGSGGPTPQDVDCVLFDGCVPKDWPTDCPVILLNPPVPVGPVRLARLAHGLPVERPRVSQADHALLLGVTTERLAVQQTAVLQAGDGLEPLWVGPAGPILLAGQFRDQRVVAMAFDVSKSERLSLLASFPLLIGNAIYWATEPASEAAAGSNHRTGQVLAVAGGKLTWRHPDPSRDGKALREEVVPVAARQAELDRIGFFLCDQTTGSASLLSAGETAIPTDGGSEGESAAAARGFGWTFVPPNLVYLLLWLVLVVLVVESWLYHRHSVY